MITRLSEHWAKPAFVAAAAGVSSSGFADRIRPASEASQESATTTSLKLEEALSKLCPNQYRVLKYQYGDNKTPAEIGEMMEETTRRVYHLRASAFKKLEKQLYKNKSSDLVVASVGK